MPMVASALSVLEKRLPKVIDARTHGIIDYCHAGFFFGMALLCRNKNPKAAAAAAFTGAFVLAESLLTDYPLGAFRVLPFEAHGRMDAAFAASSYVVPRILGFDGGSSAVFKANAFVEATVVGLTDFNNERARLESAV